MDPLRTLAGIRVAVGAGAWLAPGLSGRLFGLTGADAESAYLARLFGVRDVALAVGTVQAQGDARRDWLRLGVACDLADAGAALLGGRGGLGRATTTLTAGVALAAAGLGVRALTAPAGPSGPAAAS